VPATTNNGKNGEWLRNKFLWALLTIVFLGVVGAIERNYDADAQDRAKAAQCYEKTAEKLEKKVERQEFKDDIKELRKGMNKKFDKIDDDMKAQTKEITDLIRRVK